MYRTPLPRGIIGFFRFFLREEGGGESIHGLVVGDDGVERVGNGRNRGKLCNNV